MKKITLHVLAFFLFSLSANAFSDVNESHVYKNGIEFLKSKEIINGYADGTYKPFAVLNRAELLKILVEAAFGDSSFIYYKDSNCFSDVPSGEWFTQYICFAKENNIIKGYSDGTFKPEQDVNFVEAIKMVLGTFNYKYAGALDPWYLGIVNTASKFNFIPLDIVAFDQSLTRGQIADIITRVLKYQDGTIEKYLGPAMDFHQDYSNISNGLNNISIYRDYIFSNDENISESKSFDTPSPKETENNNPKSFDVPLPNTNKDNSEIIDTSEDPAETGDDTKYDYYNSNNEVALVCETTCPVNTDLLNAKFIGVTKSAEALKSLFQGEFPEEVKPIRIHLNVDSQCSQSFLDTVGTGYFSANIDKGGSDICLYEHERTTNKKMVDPLTLESADELYQQLLVLHEMTHALFFAPNQFAAAGVDTKNQRAPVPYAFEEVLAKSASFNLVGEENEVYYTSSLCEQSFTNYLNDICKIYGFEFKDFPKVFDMLTVGQTWYINLKKNTYISTEESSSAFVQAIFQELLGITIPMDDLKEYIKHL